MKKRLLALLLVLVMLLAVTGCAKSAGDATTPENPSASAETPAAEDKTSAGETFKIGLYQPLSGASAAYGLESKNAIEMAVDYVNANGGFNGIPGEVISYDTQGSVEEAVKVVEKLINDDKVDTIIGSIISSEVFATGNAINKAGV